MGCTNCSSGRGGLPAGCKNNGACGVNGCNKLPVFDWLANMAMPDGMAACDIVEVRFKNSRKDFFKIGDVTGLVVGDAVSVDASPGHDIGMVSMTGELVRLQLKKLSQSSDGLKLVYRKARPADLERWEEAIAKENSTMMRARSIALELKLNMKISDVEYQGDGNKAIFYYTADDRVDFRELIRHLADEFKVRVEMRQIGSRQESARLGGIGSCGRELCCSTWLRDFRSVNTSAARYQQLSLNPQKLAGQCGKLKCCLNYELDAYVDALKVFPDSNPKLETLRGSAYHQKTDIFKGIMFYTYSDEPGNFIPVPVERVNAIVEINKRGEKAEGLLNTKESVKAIKQPDYENVVGQDSLTRFDHMKGKKKKKKKKPATVNSDQSQAREVQNVQRQKPDTLHNQLNDAAGQTDAPVDQAAQNNSSETRPNRPPRNKNKRKGNGPRPPKPAES
jgi:cell fate regulator YaaT (PSP1 superfamily)